ncbi:MAG: DUF4258 domain-containing protein [Candidatus Magnetobacterium sp. LHC-1]
MVIDIEDIKEAIVKNRLKITNHAYDEAQADELSFKEILDSMINGIIIKQYPHDKPYPSCLILSGDAEDRPIHSVWAYNFDTQAGILITVYRPDPDIWLGDWKTRKK